MGRKMIKYQEALELSDIDVMPQSPTLLTAYHEADEDDGYLVSLSMLNCDGSDSTICLTRLDAELLYRWLGVVLEE